MGCVSSEMPRYFIDERNFLDDKIVLRREDYHHLKKVLRTRVGEQIEFCDGMGSDYLGILDQYLDDQAVFKVLKKWINESEPPLEVVLYQGLPKSDKMDLIIQKSVELGVTKIVPLEAKRSVVRLEGKEVSKKIDRWNKISKEASKQCGRGIIPEVCKPLAWSEALELVKDTDLSLIPYENQKEKSLKGILRETSAKKIAIFIGPEGGFDESEIDKAIKNRVFPVSLGPRILRTESAGFTILSILMYELGDIG